MRDRAGNLLIPGDELISTEGKIPQFRILKITNGILYLRDLLNLFDTRIIKCTQESLSSSKLVLYKKIILMLT